MIKNTMLGSDLKRFINNQKTISYKNDDVKATIIGMKDEDFVVLTADVTESFYIENVEKIKVKK